MAVVADSIAGQDRPWSAWLQRRLMRLLLIHDQGVFRSQFRTFFVASTLPQIPLLQQYDRYIKLITLSDELLDDIVPRIRRQLSLQTDHARLREEAPTLVISLARQARAMSTCWPSMSWHIYAQVIIPIVT